MTPTPVGMRCPECARQRTRVQTIRTMVERPVVTYALIGVNVAVQLAEMATGSAAAGGGLGGSDLVSKGGLNGPAVAAGDWWRIVTSGFLHGGLFHLAVNMYMLYILGSMLEPAVGRLRFGLIYAVSLLSGSFGALVASPHSLTVGASGAIFGLAGASVLVMRAHGVDIRASGLPLFIGINLLFSLAVPGISIGGHVGGLIGGGLAAILLFELPQRVRALPVVLPMLLAVGLGAAAVAGALAVA